MLLHLNPISLLDPTIFEGAHVHSMLQRISFIGNKEAKITNGQGIGSVLELRIMDDPNVTNLCEVHRRPDGEVNRYLDPGVKVCMRAKENLKLVNVFIKSLDYSQRSVVLRDINLMSIRHLENETRMDARENEQSKWIKKDNKK